MYAYQVQKSQNWVKKWWISRHWVGAWYFGFADQTESGKIEEKSSDGVIVAEEKSE